MPTKVPDTFTGATAAMELAALTECINRGRPFGETAWQQRTAARHGLDSTLRPRGRPPIAAKNADKGS
jgi:hypothetical protein